MSPSESFSLASAGILGILLFVFGVVYAILTFLLPFIVYGVLRQARISNQLLERAITALAEAKREIATNTKEAAYQAELTVAALQRIKDSEDQLVTHAQYQTEVSKHRLALESQTPAGA